MGILTMISQATKRMENLIEDLLSFSRAGKSFIQKEAVNLNELVEEILQDYSAETKDRQIQWIIHPLGGRRGRPRPAAAGVRQTNFKCLEVDQGPHQT
jgi:signal transduction histidine kinase